MRAGEDAVLHRARGREEVHRARMYQGREGQAILRGARRREAVQGGGVHEKRGWRMFQLYEPWGWQEVRECKQRSDEPLLIISHVTPLLLTPAFFLQVSIR